MKIRSSIELDRALKTLVDKASVADTLHLSFLCEVNKADGDVLTAKTEYTDEFALFYIKYIASKNDLINPAIDMKLDFQNMDIQFNMYENECGKDLDVEFVVYAPSNLFSIRCKNPC